MNAQFRDKRILITGGCGSIGVHILNEIIKQDPQVVRMLDINEKGLYYIKNKYNRFENIRYLLGDVRDEDRIIKATENIDIIFHTAALKHIFSCEYNPFEALKTNVIGTQNVINAALENEVDKMMFTSSDKAVNPTNVMGITKLMAERLVINANYYRGKRDTKFSCLRFGNILNSSGSFFKLFKKQIQSGGPITITDKKMSRYIMTIPEVLSFIMKSTELSLGGEIFISKMKSINILDFAGIMAQEFTPNNHKMKYKYIGKMPGEKIFEEIMTENEIKNALESNDLYIILPEIGEFKHKDINRYLKSKKVTDIIVKSSDEIHMTEKEIIELLKKL